MSLFRPSREMRAASVESPPRPVIRAAGVTVTPTAARQKVAFQASIDLIAGKASTLPVRVYRRRPGGALTRTNAPTVLRDPEGLGYGYADFAYRFISDLMTRGNAFVSPVQMSANGRPSMVELLPLDDIRMVQRDGEWKVSRLGKEDLPMWGASQLDGVRHARAYPVDGKRMGESVIAHHARTIGLALASEQFGADFFADGAHPSGILSTSQAVTEDQARTIKDRFVAAIRGSREPAVLGGGVTYTQVQISPAESQFLETQEYTSAEVCRIFGPGVAEMLGYETGGSMTYSNVQSRSLHLLIYAIDPWLNRLEQFISDYLLAPSEIAVVDRNALLAMTATDRWGVNQKRLMLGATTINRVLAEEGEEPVAWGDEPYLPSFMTSAAQTVTQAEVAPEGKSA